jgi:uncharacterized protein YecT (DUF1311 family)
MDESGMGLGVKHFMLGMLVVTGQAAAAQDCANPQDQSSMNICADRAYKASDAELNAAYKALTESVSAEGREKLQAAQRAWITFRDAQCSFETMGTADGSVHPMVLSGCLDEVTRAQTARLVAQLNCAEGDLSCGGQ